MSNYTLCFFLLFPGACHNDGFYYKDAYSFVICSNGNGYELPCAPGSQNNPYDDYSYDNKYGYHDFCGVNLVDDGYGAGHGGGYAHKAGHGAPHAAAPAHGNYGYY